MSFSAELTNDVTPDEVSQRLRGILRNVRNLEESCHPTRRSALAVRYIDDVRYTLGVASKLVDDRQRLRDGLEQLADDHDTVVSALTRALEVVTAERDALLLERDRG